MRTTVRSVVSVTDTALLGIGEQTVSTDADATVTSLGGKFFTFMLGNEEYGLEILKVREIIGLMAITSVPRTAEYVRGIINLRGKIIPVVDIRVKFGMDVIEDTEETCIIVVECSNEDHTMTMGILVDRVSEVLDIGDEDIEPPPDFGNGFQARFILGMAKVEDSVKILLDADAILSVEEASNLSSDSKDD